MKKTQKKKYLALAGACLAVMVGIVYYFFFTSFSKKTETVYVYVDNDDDVDSIMAKLSDVGTDIGMTTFRTLARHTDYDKHVHTGRYAIGGKDNTLRVFRNLQKGHQEPVHLTIPSVRTLDRLSGFIGEKLMLDSMELYDALTNADTCATYGLDTATIACMFIPNTYDIYWNSSLRGFLDRMKKEYDAFWNAERKQKAERMGLSPVEVSTLASIVDEETTNDAEKPMIAGMYYNRLKINNSEYPNGMPLQADPTVKFALGKFEARRIYRDWLTIDNPYNTYRNTGLPPGPIRIPSVAGIDAVLNHVQHDYLYMCAKEDFSGTHNFAATYAEHQKNARKYAEALNKRGIK